MKSKVMTRAMAIFLAVIMSFTLIIPETFAASDNGNDDSIAVSVESNGKTMGEKYRDGEIDKETWLNSLPDDQYNKETREFYIPGEDGEILAVSVDDLTAETVPGMPDNENTSTDSKVQAYSGDIQTYADGWGTSHQVTYYADMSVTIAGSVNNTGYFQIDDGTLAWCCQHTNDTPAVGTWMDTSAVYEGDNILCRIAYYGYNGPEYAYSWFSNYIFNTCSWLGAADSDVDHWAYRIEDLAFSLENPDWTTHTSAETRYGGAYVDYCESQNYPGGLTVYKLYSGSSTTQDLMYWTYDSNGYLKIVKTSPNMDTSNGNYDMSGAQYTVYTDSACTQVASTANGSSAVLTIQKTSSGTWESETVEMAVGTYYVKETKAPDGFNMDTNVYTATVTSDNTITNPVVIYSSDYTLGSYLSLEKSSANPGITDGNSCYSFAGAEYTVYTNSSCSNDSIAKTFNYGDERGGGEDAVLKVNADGSSNEIALYAGTYYVKETALPTNGSYGWDENIYTVDLTSNPNDHIKVYVSDPPVNDDVGLILTKISDDDDLDLPAPLDGAEFTVKYYDGYYDSTSSLPSSATRTWVIKTEYRESIGEYCAYLDNEHKVSGDDFYYDDYGLVVIPLGTITVQETKAAEGYTLEGSYLNDTSKTFKTDDNGVILMQVTSDNSTSGASVEGGNYYTKTDKVIRGGVAIYKYDPETYTMMDGPQGDASLKGATFAIRNLNDYQVKVDGTIYDSDDIVKYIDTEEITNDDGSVNYVAYTDDDTLPYGDYEIYECEPSTGYMIPDTNYDFEFSIVNDHEYVSYDVNGNKLAVGNIVIRGGVEIMKRDLESGYDTPEGGASLENAELTIYNESTHPVLVNGVLYQPGEAVMVLYTDENSYATTGDRALPYGTYKLVETLAPEGYLPYAQNKENTKDDSETVGVLERDFVIRTDGEMIDLTDQTYDFDKQDYVACAEAGSAIYNQVIRGDFAIRKIDSDTQKKMTGVIFKIESETTHEYHYFMTDENGAYSSAVDYAEHTHNTNYHDDESTWDETDIQQLENHCGMWFYGYDDPDSTQIDDSLGALPYDTYTITEIKTEANKNYVMWEDTFTVGPNDNNIVIDLNDIENTTWDIDTVATFESTNSKYAPVSENTITIDAVSYENLTIGHEYTLVAKLYDKNTQNFVKNAYGEDVMSVTAFTPRLHFGTANTEIVFDSTGLDGHDIVVFEYVYDGDDLMKDPVLYETNPEEANQTLHFPEVQTTALDAETGNHVSFADETITIVDTVEYSNLQPGREYTVTGTLMNQKTGEPVLTADGEEITSEATFTPDEPDGYVTVVFDFDGTGLEGVVTVVFEHVYYKGVEYAAHADINDEGQTVYIPKIHTTAWAEETGINAASAGEDITLYDTVSYKGVESGQEYHIFSVLFDAETHEAEVDSDGNEIWSDYGPFTAEESEGQVDLEFNIDAGQMEGHRTVFYEILYQVETDEETGEVTYTLIAEEDLADAPDETIYFPDIHTNAYDSETGENIMEARENVTLIDTVTYTNLAPGHEYTVTGVMMDKETGEPILDAEGDEITSEAAFTPEESDGTVEVEFTFDATGLEGTTIVVFEDLYYEDIQLTTHADLEDEDQTVYVPEIHTTAIAEDTGTHETIAEGTVTIVDTVEYTNLLPGKTYTMSGELMDEATGESLGITANTVFTPEEPDGTVDVTFTFDADGMDDMTVVVFEECSIATEEEDVPVAEHKDLTDTDQQVKLTAPPTTDTPTGTPTSTDSPKTGQIAGFSALGVTLAAAGAAVAGTVARKKKTGAGA